MENHTTCESREANHQGGSAVSRPLDFDADAFFVLGSSLATDGRAITERDQGTGDAGGVEGSTGEGDESVGGSRSVDEPSGSTTCPTGTGDCGTSTSSGIGDDCSGVATGDDGCGAGEAATASGGSSGACNAQVQVEGPGIPLDVLYRPIIAALMFALVVTVGLGAHLWREARTWQGRHAELERSYSTLLAMSSAWERAAPAAAAAASAPPLPPQEPAAVPPLCLGSRPGDAGGEDAAIINSCWLKVQLGDCGKDLLKDPVKAFTGAWHDLEKSFWDTWGTLSDMVHSDLDLTADSLAKGVEGAANAVEGASRTLGRGLRRSYFFSSSDP